MICIIAGTNRPQSQSLRLAKIYDRLFKAQGAETEIINLEDLPSEIFKPEAYAEKPASFAPFSDAVLRADGLFITVPEYNGSFPGALKLFIDMLKFPESFENKPVAFAGLSAGIGGSWRSVEQLEMVFKYRNAHAFNQRVFFPRVETQIDENDNFTQDLIKQLVDSQVKNYIKFIRSLKSS